MVDAILVFLIKAAVLSAIGWTLYLCVRLLFDDDDGPKS